MTGRVFIGIETFSEVSTRLVCTRDYAALRSFALREGIDERPVVVDCREGFEELDQLLSGAQEIWTFNMVFEYCLLADKIPNFAKAPRQYDVAHPTKLAGELG